MAQCFLFLHQYHTPYEWADFEASRKARPCSQSSWKSMRIHVEIETSKIQINDFTHFPNMNKCAEDFHCYWQHF